MFIRVEKSISQTFSSNYTIKSAFYCIILNSLRGGDMMLGKKKNIDYYYRSEVHVINTNNPLYNYCNEICYKSKNLYNYANYLIRKEYFETGTLKTSSFDLNKLLKTEDVYKSLPAKTSQQVIIRLRNNWNAYFRAIKDWSKNPSKYTGKPKIPKYKDKNGRNIVCFDYQQVKVKEGKIKFQLSNECIETRVRQEDFKLLEIIPYGTCYKISIIYKTPQVEKLQNDNVIAIDLGIDNLATLTNNIGQQPIIINGKVIKSTNQYYNKKLAKVRSYIGVGSSNRIQKLNLKRNNIIDTHFHRISRWIINYCKAYNISTIVIGRNKDWQRNVNLGKKTNQKFVQIPFEKLIYQLQYKAEDVGITVIVNEESYTSKASFIDGDKMVKGTEFSGKRIKRGLYRSKEGILINADVNGSYNILRKCNAQFSYESIEGVSLHPIRLTV